MCRQMTDRRLQEFAALPEVPDRVRAAVGELSVYLSAARADADAVLRQPPERRSDFDISAAIGAMVALAPLLFPTMDQMLADMTVADPTLATPLAATRTASDLRLYGGSIAAMFNLVMAKRRPVTPHDFDDIRIQQGRILELHLLLLANIGIADVGQQVRDEVQSMEERYFGAAQRVVDRMIATGVRDGRFDLTQQEFIARFAPELKALSGVRDRLFALTRQAMQADQAARLQPAGGDHGGGRPRAAGHARGAADAAPVDHPADGRTGGDAHPSGTRRPFGPVDGAARQP